MKKSLFSESIFWVKQCNYSEKEGMDTCSDDVPLYVTINNLIPNTHAQFAIRFIQEWIRKNHRE